MSAPVSTTQRDSFSSAQRWCWTAGIAVLYLSCAFFHLGQLPLQDPDEPRYASAGRTMADGGSWLLPQFNGVPRINKPPLFYWLVGISDKIFGTSNEFTSRLPAVLMGALMLCGTVLIGRKVFGDRVGYWAGLILASSPLFMVVSRICIPDMTFSTFLGLALLCLLCGVSNAWTNTKISSVMAAGLILALGFMAKATAGLIVIFTPLIFMLFGGRAALGQYFSREKKWALALLIGLSGFWWYGYLINTMGYENFKALVKFEVAGRLAGDVHHQPPYYYIPILLGTFFPWSLGSVGIFGTAITPIQSEDHSVQNNRVIGDRFLLAWVFTVFVFFSVPGAKLAHYILPMFPALALLAARCFERLSNEEVSLAQGWRIAMVACPLLLGVVLFAGGWTQVTDAWPEKPDVHGLTILLMIGVVFMAGASAWWVTKQSASGVLIGAAIWLLAGLLMAYGFPALKVYVFRKDWLVQLNSIDTKLGGIGPRLIFLLMLPAVLMILRPKIVKWAMIAQAAVLAIALMVGLNQLMDRFEDRSQKDFALQMLAKSEMAGVKNFYQTGCDNKESLKYYLKRTVEKMKEMEKAEPKEYPEIFKKLAASGAPGTVVLVTNRKLFEWYIQKPPAGTRVWHQSDDKSMIALINEPAESLPVEKAQP